VGLAVAADHGSRGVGAVLMVVVVVLDVAAAVAGLGAEGALIA